MNVNKVGSLRWMIGLSVVIVVLIAVGWLGRMVAAGSKPPVTPPSFSVLPPQFEQSRSTDMRRLDAVDQTRVAPVYGVDFISSAESQTDDQQFANAHATGATWDRWPLYWNGVETSPGNYNWTNVDATVSAEIDQGFQLNLILLRVPGFYWSGGRDVPSSLYESVFDDGTDIGGPGKQINPNNAWARFVAAAVNRYKPDGTLAQAENWPAGAGVTHWEIWNEPDLPFFWHGTKAEYARLLKVGYLATKHADSDSVVLFGAVANSYEAGFFDYYADVLSILSGDPQSNATGFFHDIFATHSYFYAWQTWYHIDRAKDAMAVYGLDHPVWLNESGVPAWDDYPGPVWDGTSAFRATKPEQADYTIQSAFYAITAGAEAIFHFQLMDGCGNQPAGTDFPPHNGELCDANGNLVSDPSKPCAGDAFGLFSNATDAACFRQHPEPETGRLNFGAFQVLTEHVTDVEPLWYQPGGPVEQIALYRPNSGERLLAVWARAASDETVTIGALDGSAELIAPDGTIQTVNAVNGQYVLNLPGATNNNYPFGEGVYAIGGRPVIVRETDRQAPAVTMSASVVTTPTVQLNWSGGDGLGSGLVDYTVWVATNGAEAVSWLAETTQTQAVFAGEIGDSYTFTVTARDRASNIGSAESITIDFSDIFGSKVVDQTDVEPGDTVIYTITVGNTSDMTATLQLTDTLPLETTLITDTLTTTLGIATYADGSIMWNGVLPPDSTVQIVFSTLIDADLDPDVFTRIVNRALLVDETGRELWFSAESFIGEIRYNLPIVTKQ